jgi:limonene-1,2-epoxide hydrolase
MPEWQAMAESLTPAETARAFLKAMEPLDYDRALQLVAEDCEYRNVPIATVNGHAGIRAVLEPFFAPTRQNEFRVLREVSVGSIVVLERLDRHLLPSGWVELPVVGIFEIRNGLISLWHDYFDAATLLKSWPTG